MNLILFTIMFFNNDSIVVVSAILVLGVFTYTFYNNIFTTVQNTSNTVEYKEVGVQTESLVNTAPSTEPISELSESTNSFLWDLFQVWLKKLYGINGSDIVRKPTDLKVVNWLYNLNPSQSIPSSNIISSSSESNIVEVSDLIYDNSESVLELVSLYDIMDYTHYGQAISQPNAIFDHIIVNNIHQYFIFINDIILSVNPDLINPFI
jgi:hypothetical protein